jgi:hypothetical protein
LLRQNSRNEAQAARFLVLQRIAAVRSLRELSTASFQNASFANDRSPRFIITDLPEGRRT